jgi:deazaflavin-dependent oxidoreductase (nitroreductase family)
VVRKRKTAEPPSGALRVVLRAPVLLYRLGLGRVLGRRFLLLEHVGRKTGSLRRTVLEVVEHDVARDVYYVAVGFGPRSDWYRNLVKTPECLIIVGSSRSARRARTVSPAEGADLMAGYAGHHPKAARALMRLMGFEVDGSEADYRQVAALGLRFVGLEPR